MDILLILQYVSVALTLVTGLLSLLWPRSIKGFTGLEASSPRAMTEIRAVMGGVFVGLGIAALILRTPEVFVMLGITYATIAVIRAISMVLDKSMERSNVISLVIEIVVAIILIL